MNSKYSVGIRYLTNKLIEYQCSNKSVVPYSVAKDMIKETADKFNVSERTVRNWIKKCPVIFRFGTQNQLGNQINESGYIVILPEVGQILKAFSCHPLTMRQILESDLDKLEEIIQFIIYRKISFKRQYYFKSYQLIKPLIEQTTVLKTLYRDRQVKYILCYFRMIVRLVYPEKYLLEDLFKQPIIPEIDLPGCEGDEDEPDKIV